MVSHSQEGEFGFQIAPMLDILFVLLLFFMVSAGLQKREATLTTHLLGEGIGGKVQVNLEIASDGQVLFDGAPLDTPTDHQLPETFSKLKAILAVAPENPVVISPAPDVRHQRVMDVLNICKAADARNVAFSSASQ